MQFAISLLHQTAHWKWIQKKWNGNCNDESVFSEPGGEAGRDLEECLFGGQISLDRNELNYIVKRTGEIKKSKIPVKKTIDWMTEEHWRTAPIPPLGRREPLTENLLLNLEIVNTTYLQFILEILTYF